MITFVVDDPPVHYISIRSDKLASAETLTYSLAVPAMANGFDVRFIYYFSKSESAKCGEIKQNDQQCVPSAW